MLQAEARVKFPGAVLGDRRTLIPLLPGGNPASMLCGTGSVGPGTWGEHRETSGRWGRPAAPLGAVYMGAVSVGKLTALHLRFIGFLWTGSSAAKMGFPRAREGFRNEAGERDLKSSVRKSCVNHGWGTAQKR